MKEFKFKNIKSQEAQAMLIVVMILGATMLGVATIAGYVSLQKIKTVAEIMDSTKAIYAADAGVEWCFYNKFSSNGTSTFVCDTGGFVQNFSNGASFSAVESGDVIRVVGRAFNSYRSFGIFLNAYNQNP